MFFRILIVKRFQRTVKIATNKQNLPNVAQQIRFSFVLRFLDFAFC